MVAPVPSNTYRVYPFQVLLPRTTTGRGRPSKAQAEQIRSIAVERFGPQVGVGTAECVTPIDEALRVHLAL